MTDGSVGVKCRFPVRGSKDKFQDFDTYAGATSRSGQRLVNAVVAENQDVVLLGFNVSQAFAKGMTFAEFSALTGTELREVQFDVPKADLVCLRQIRGFEDFNPGVETLIMLKHIYGLDGAPRAWRKKVHQALIQWMPCRQLHSEPELYCHSELHLGQ